MTTLREALAADIAELDPKLKTTDATYAAALFLLASMNLGPDVEAIADECEMDMAFVAVAAERARRARIWTDGGVNFAPWEDEDSGGTAFWLDCAIIEGHMEKAGADSYQLTEAGRRHVETMMSNL